MKYLTLLLIVMLPLSHGLASDLAPANHGTVSDLNVEYSVTLAEVDNDAVLQVKLKNNSTQTYYIRGGELPWARFAGVKIYVTATFFVPTEQKWETDYLPEEHLAGLPTVVLKPGNEVSGTYKLSLYYDKIKDYRAKGDIGINWNLEVKLRDKDPYESRKSPADASDKNTKTALIGGFFILPESRR